MVVPLRVPVDDGGAEAGIVKILVCRTVTDGSENADLTGHEVDETRDCAWTRAKRAPGNTQ